MRFWLKIEKKTTHDRKHLDLRSGLGFRLKIEKKNTIPDRKHFDISRRLRFQLKVEYAKKGYSMNKTVGGSGVGFDKK